jgi:hypothetical protein
METQQLAEWAEEYLRQRIGLLAEEGEWAARDLKAEADLERLQTELMQPDKRPATAYFWVVHRAAARVVPTAVVEQRQELLGLVVALAVVVSMVVSVVVEQREVMSSTIKILVAKVDMAAAVEEQLSDCLLATVLMVALAAEEVAGVLEETVVSAVAAVAARTLEVAAEAGLDWVGRYSFDREQASRSLTAASIRLQ